MTNNVLYVSDGDYGKRVGYLSAVVQGQYGQVIPLEIRDLANTVVNLTGYSTITGTLNDQRGNVTNIAGTLALDATPSTAPNANWTIAAADFGTPGVFMVMLTLSNGSATLKTIPVALTVHADPAVTAVPGTPLVGVTTAQAALIAALAQLSGLANFNGTGGATGIKINLSATAAPGVGDDSGDGYAIGSIWLDTTNDNIYMATDVTVGAANWEQISGAGGGAVDSVFGRTGAVIAASGDYDATEVSYDSGVPGVWETVALALAGIDSNNNATVIDLDAHIDATTNVHGIADTSLLLDTSDIGATVQAYSAKTAAIAGLTWAANSIILLTGTATASVQALAAHIVTFLQSASAADARTAIGASDTTEYIVIACSDETTALAAGTAKATFRMPYAMTLTGVRASVTTAPTGSTLTVDINDGGTTILSTKLTIDATEETSTTAATPAVISDTALASDAEITIDIDSVGSTVAGAGLKVTLIGTR